MRPAVTWVCLAFVSVGAAAARSSDRAVAARAQQQLGKALDAAKATPAQRVSLAVAVNQLVASTELAFGVPATAEIDTILALFEHDTIDGTAVAAIKRRRSAGYDLVAAALVQAFNRFHDTLSPEQRQRLIDHVRKRVEGRRLRKLKQGFLELVVAAQVEDLLERTGASEPERATVRVARDEVLAAFRAPQAALTTFLDRVAALFRADAVDQAELGKVREEKLKEVLTIVDTLERALVQIHDGLTPEHRQRLVELVRARRAHRVPAHVDEL